MTDCGDASIDSSTSQAPQEAARGESCIEGSALRADSGGVGVNETSRTLSGDSSFAETETRVAERGVMADVRTAAIAAVLAPVLVVHFVVLILPLRIAHAVTDDGTDVVQNCDAGSSSSSTEKNSRSDDRNASSDGAPGGGGDASFVEGGREAIARVVEGDDIDAAANPVAGASRTEEGADEAVVGGDLKPLSVSGHEGKASGARIAAAVDRGSVDDEANGGGEATSGEWLEGAVDGVPAAIRRNLGRPELGIRR